MNAGKAMLIGGQVSREYEDEFFRSMAALNVEPAGIVCLVNGVKRLP